jgi:hypothetical protein
VTMVVSSDFARSWVPSGGRRSAQSRRGNAAAGRAEAAAVLRAPVRLKGKVRLGRGSEECRKSWRKVGREPQRHHFLPRHADSHDADGGANCGGRKGVRE